MVVDANQSVSVDDEEEGEDEIMDAQDIAEFMD